MMRVLNHSREFPYIWVLLLALAAIAVLIFIAPSYWLFFCRLIGIIIGLLIALVLIRPMNAVYGLMGTSGSIRMFFINFLLITILFAGVYYLAFFKDAGISYDTSQPHIDFEFYSAKNQEKPRVMIKRDTSYLEHRSDSICFKEPIVHITRDTLNYQSISFWEVWRSSVLTTLTQEPTELLNTATFHYPYLRSTDVTLDSQKSTLFEWILIFHILISWIFFGVFISLLYNKFRYES